MAKRRITKRKKPKYPRAGRYIKGGFARWSCYMSWGQFLGVRLTLPQMQYYLSLPEEER